LRQDANVLLAAPSSGAIPPITDELPFKVVRSNGTDEVLARAMNLLIARGAYREAARIYPEDLIELRQGARIIEKSLADEAHPSAKVFPLPPGFRWAAHEQRADL
jgi:hypothetical protein